MGITMSVATPAVAHLAFPAAIGDGETLGTFLDAVSALVTDHAGQEVSVSVVTNSKI